MKIKFLVCVSFINMTLAVVADSTTPPWFMECLTATSQQYRQAVMTAVNRSDVKIQLQSLLDKELKNVESARQARILMARVNYPAVFCELENLLEEWRTVEKSTKPRGIRPGQLSGRIIAFTKKSPECRQTEEYVRDNNGNMVLETYPSKGGGKLKAMRNAKRIVEKYTEAEVQSGIARNAAARQAVLEQFLKFLGEGNAYEQSELVDVVCQLWGHDRVRRNADLAVVDSVPDAGTLAADVFRNSAHPLAARMQAFENADGITTLESQVFMLYIVTNALPESITMMGQRTISKALLSLESSGDAVALSVLKNQTNAPSWKREWIEKSVQNMEKRFSQASEIIQSDPK